MKQMEKYHFLSSLTVVQLHCLLYEGVQCNYAKTVNSTGMDGIKQEHLVDMDEILFHFYMQVTKVRPADTVFLFQKKWIVQ